MTPCKHCDATIPGIDGMCLEHLREAARRAQRLCQKLSTWRGRRHEDEAPALLASLDDDVIKTMLLLWDVLEPDPMGDD